MKSEPCSQYVAGQKVCRSGWPVVSGTCFGIIHAGCAKCGAGTELTTPPCMQDDPPRQFIRDDGLPAFWPEKSAGQQQEGQG